MLVLATSLITACTTSPNSVAGCIERDPVSLSVDELPDPPQGSPWSLAQMRAGIEGVHRGELHPIASWYDQPEDVPPERFTPIVLEARLRPEAQLIEFDDDAGPNYDCSVQDIRLFADVELRREDGELLGVAKMVELHVTAGDDETGGSLYVPASDALADVLWEDVATLPEEIQVTFGFNFDADSELPTALGMSGWAPEIDSTRPLARALLEGPVPFDE